MATVATPKARSGMGASWVWLALLVVLVAGLGLGAAVGLGVQPAYLVVGLLLPFALLLMLVKPDWVVTAYVVLVYADLLSVLVREHGLPPLARYAGVALLLAVLGHRLITRREGLVGDAMTGWMVAYGAVIAIGLFYAREPDLIFTNLVEFARNLILYVIVINTLTTQARVRRTLWAMLAAGAFLASLTLYQVVTGQYDRDFGGLAVFRASEIVGGSDAPRPGGTIGDANYYGQSLLILVPIGLYLLTSGRRLLVRLAGLATSVILIAAIIFTYSRGDAVALAAVLGAAVLYKRPRLPYLLGGLVALLLLVPLIPSNYFARLGTLFDVLRGDRQTLYTEESIRGRAGATQAAIDMFLDHPLVGVGREHYPLYQLEYLSGNSLAYRAKGIPPHNLYLEVAAEHGLLGIVTMGGVLLLTWRALFDARRRFLRVGDKGGGELAAWLAIGYFGYLVSALSLHGAFPSYLWLQVALIVALRQVAMRASPDVVVPTLPTLVSLPAHRDVAVQPNPQEAAATSRWGTLRALIAERMAETREALRQPRPGSVAAGDGMVARFGLWLDAAEAARRRGDLLTAQALVDAVLERDPGNRRARQVLLRLRLSDKLLTTSPQPPLTFVGAQVARTYKVADAFREFYLKHGGERIFGPPVSPLFVEATPDGGVTQVQYFRRARLELYASPLGEPPTIQAGKLGLESPIEGRLASPLPIGLRGRQVELAPGRAGVPWKFAIFWQLNKGRELWGLPISPVLAIGLVDEGTIYVQYFERTRLEYYPRLADTIDEVQLADLGALVFERRYSRRTI